MTMHGNEKGKVFIKKRIRNIFNKGEMSWQVSPNAHHTFEEDLNTDLFLICGCSYVNSVNLKILQKTFREISISVLQCKI
jgi:hypothetical protein